jgi:hypothetical protein
MQEALAAGLSTYLATAFLFGGQELADAGSAQLMLPEAPAAPALPDAPQAPGESPCTRGHSDTLVPACLRLQRDRA